MLNLDCIYFELLNTSSELDEVIKNKLGKRFDLHIKNETYIIRPKESIVKDNLKFVELHLKLEKNNDKILLKTFTRINYRFYRIFFIGLFSGLCFVLFTPMNFFNLLVILIYITIFININRSALKRIPQIRENLKDFNFLGEECSPNSTST